MRKLTNSFALLLLLSIAGGAHAVIRTQEAAFNAAAGCAPEVDKSTLAAIAQVESGFNPFAIGVVGGHLERQPDTYGEAVATAESLERLGYNFSMGLVQVNRYNLARFGETYRTIFDTCRNLRTGSKILAECFKRAKAAGRDDQSALRAAFSCYYSGNFTTGFREGYVDRILASAAEAPKPQSAASGAIPVVRTSRAAPDTRAEDDATPREHHQWVFISDDSAQTLPNASKRDEQHEPNGEDATRPHAQTDYSLRANQSPVNVTVAPDDGLSNTRIQPQPRNASQSKAPFVEIEK